MAPKPKKVGPDPLHKNMERLVYAAKTYGPYLLVNGSGPKFFCSVNRIEFGLAGVRIPTSFPGSLILTPGASEERPW